jgi:phage regulator Rha-like protein
MSDDGKLARIENKLTTLTATTSSIDSFEAADLLEQSHEAVLATIDKISNGAPRDWCKPITRLGAPRAFELNRSGFMLLAMNPPGKRTLQERLRIIELFDEMWDATASYDHR